MSLNTILWLSGSVAEAAVIGLLLYRRVWRSLPVFFIYSVWTLVGSVAAFTIYQNYAAHYVTAYLVELIVDSGLLFGVLVELAWSVLRPLRASLSPTALFVVAGLILIIGAAIWPLAAIPGAANLPPELAFLMRMQQTFSILRVLAFLALAGCSQLLSIGWRNRELQIATGLGFTSLVGLAVAMIHSHQTARSQYSHLNEIVVASYICSLLYWVFSFAQKEEQRREFTPQMQNLLLAVAGAAKTTRIAMEDSGSGKTRKF